LSLDNGRKDSNKYEVYELFYLRSTSIFLIISAVAYFARKIFVADVRLFAGMSIRSIIWSVAVCILVFGLQFIRYRLFKKYLLEYKVIYFIEKVSFAAMVSAIVIFSDIGIWFYLGLFLPLVMATYIKGPKYGCGLLFTSWVIHMALMYLMSMPEIAGEGLKLSDVKEDIYAAAVLFIMSFAAVYFFSRLYIYRIENELLSNYAIEQLDERCLTLENERDIIQKEIKALISNSDELEKANESLKKSIAEFFTLNKISQAIGSILDTKELLKRLNDIILGVVGCSCSSIILFDSESNRLKVHTTNITNKNELATLTDNINCSILRDALDKGEYILENNVDYFQYVFTCGRNINSLMCIPLTTNSRKYGLILVEHTVNNAFDEENVKFLSIIAQQVGIVMENAELYFKMKELARKDGLTGIYNRQYFQERLEVEFNEAKKNNYPLSLVIFDIDHFKKFNDMYGHLFGDKVLTSVAEVVCSNLRKSDLIARYGGEEFILLLPRTSLDEAYEKVEDLRKLISGHVINDNLISVSVTASFGISSYDECAFNENDLIRTADDALYMAKESGRNCVMTARRLYDKKIIQAPHAAEKFVQTFRSDYGSRRFDQ